MTKKQDTKEFKKLLEDIANFKLMKLPSKSGLDNLEKLTAAYVKPNIPLPSKVDLRDKMSAVENQFELGSCTANAICGLMEYKLKIINQFTSDLSRLFIYWVARSYRGWTNVDSGSFVADGLKGIKEKGACTETIWPYVIKNFNKEPTSACYKQALEYKVEEFYCLQDSDLKYSLAQGNPVVIGTMVYSSLMSEEAADTGIIKMPEVGEKHKGAHAMLIVGYNDDNQTYLVRNSWGNLWGDNGYCYIPYDYLLRYGTEYYTFDNYVNKDPDDNVVEIKDEQGNKPVKPDLLDKFNLTYVILAIMACVAVYALFFK